MILPTPIGRAAVARPNRMTLSAIARGRNVDAPPRILVYGLPGVGKSTFASEADGAVFLPVEDGVAQLDVASFPRPESWPEVLDTIDTLASELHDFKAFVVDTLDWSESLLWKHLCERDGVDTIEKVSGGYGKGYSAALDEWNLFLSKLERVRRERKMTIIFLAHSKVVTFKNPAGEDYDTYEMKLDKRASAKLSEWCDAVFFAAYDIAAVGKTKKAIGGDNRLLHATKSGAWHAKNRYSLPDTLPLSWASFDKARREHRPADPKQFAARIAELLPQIEDAEIREAAAETAKEAGANAAELARICNKLESMVSLNNAGKEESK